MKKFVAIYLGSAEGLAEWKATNDETRKEREKAGMEEWMKWAKDNEASQPGKIPRWQSEQESIARPI
jgi:hypothetical protein